MQDRERMTPMGEPSIVEFNSQLLFIAEPELGKVFNDRIR